MKIFLLNKIPFCIKNNAVRFLSGITSNTIDAPNNAFLNIHGRIIATFDQLQLSEDEVIILIEAPFVDDVLKHIDRYVKLGGVSVKPLERHVYWQLSGGMVSDMVIFQKQGCLVMSDEVFETNVSEEEFTLFRLKNHIPVHGKDYTDEMLLNVSTIDFVSFTKGCYLGQEPISKVHNRSKPTWKLTVKYEDDCSEEERLKMTSNVPDETGRRIGFVFVRNQ